MSTTTATRHAPHPTLRTTISAIAITLTLLIASIAMGQTMTASGLAVATSPTGFGVAINIDVPFLDLPALTPEANLAFRAGAHATFADGMRPAADLGLTLHVPTTDATFYAGTTAGYWWSIVRDVPCWDLTWLLHGGIDLPINESIAARIEAQGAPLIGGIRVAAGLAIQIGN